MGRSANAESGSRGAPNAELLKPSGEIGDVAPLAGEREADAADETLEELGHVAALTHGREAKRVDSPVVVERQRAGLKREALARVERPGDQFVIDDRG